jgi:hypothetical protein
MAAGVVDSLGSVTPHLTVGEQRNQPRLSGVVRPIRAALGFCHVRACLRVIVSVMDALGSLNDGYGPPACISSATIPNWSSFGVGSSKLIPRSSTMASVGHFRIFQDVCK